MMARPASGMWSKPSTANASIRVLLPEPGPPVMTWKSGRSAIARTFRFRVERALAPPLSERQHIASVVALNARCTIEQRAVKGGAIIVGQLAQTGFLDEAAQLYEMRSEEHTYELQSLMRISYTGFCCKKKHTNNLPSTH